MTFRDWLSEQATRDDRVGDLARDCEADDCWMGNTPESLYDHIGQDHGDWPPAMETVRIAAVEWRTL
jgi:hypothetical protein